MVTHVSTVYKKKTIFKEYDEKLMLWCLQEIQAKLQVEKTRLTDQLKEEKESSTREIQHLKKTLSDTESHHEGEKAYLKENLSQVREWNFYHSLKPHQ